MNAATPIDANRSVARAGISTHPRTALSTALDRLLQLDIPAKGRIAHHIRNGRINRALALCAQGRVYLWKRVWQHRALPAILDQVQLLCQLEKLLIQESHNATA